MCLRRLFLKFALGVLLLLGCRPAFPTVGQLGNPAIEVHVYVSSEFPSRERLAIETGVSSWAAATKGTIVLQWFTAVDGKLPNVQSQMLSDGTQMLVIVFRRAVSSDGWVVKWENDYERKNPKKSKTLLGMHFGKLPSTISVIYVIEDRLINANMWSWLSGHEFGHALGLNHVEDNKSIISEYYDSEATVATKDDVKEFCRVWRC